MEYYTAEDLKEQRKSLNQSIQDSFDKQTTYREKLIYIYNLILTSQCEYLKYKNNTLFTEDTLQKLISEMSLIEKIDDSKFIDFIQDKIITPIDAGHLQIKSHEIIESEEFKKQKEEYIAKHRDELNQKKNIETETIDDSNTLIIKIKSFSRHHLEEDKKVLENLREYLDSNDIQNVIIDIRGNTGGTDEYFRYLSMLTSEPMIITDRFRNLFTSENQSVKWNAMEGNGKDYNRYLLVDGKVFSTAESLAIFCKQTGFATIVGEPTLGEGYGATPFMLNISDCEYSGKYQRNGVKKVGMSLVFPIEAPINEKGEIDYNHFYRTIPDIMCTSEEALQVAIGEIEAQKRISR